MHNKNEESDAFLARNIGEQMLLRLDFMALKPKKIVVLGEEEEFYREQLQERYPTAEILSEKEMLTLANHSIDFIFANLYLACRPELREIFTVWKKILRPEGLLLFSTLGPDTLIELQPHHSQDILLYLQDMHNVGDELIRARFADPVLDVERLNVSYPNLTQLAQELQNMHLIAQDVAEIQLSATSENLFSITFEIIYGHAFGPAIEADHVADNEGTVKIPLSHLQRRYNKHN